MNQDLFSGIADISMEWNAPKESAMTFVDLFAGCGGLSCGLEMAGLKGVAAVEYKESASITYTRNFNHPIISDDITKESTKERLYKIVEERTEGKGVDVVAGGPPCQGFSMAGKRLIDDPRNVLYKEFVEVVKHLNPRFIVMENVPGMCSMDNGKVIQQILYDFNKIGYDVSVKVLNAADYFTPQIRKRTIFIGNRIGVRNLHPEPLLTAKNYVSVNDAICDLTYMPEDKAFSQQYTHHGHKMVENISRLKPGDRLNKRYKGTLRRLYADKPSPTVTYSNGSCDIHPFCDRVFTVRELARLQSFTDTFHFYGNKEDQGIMVGNAVPPLLGKAIGLALQQMSRT